MCSQAVSSMGFPGPEMSCNVGAIAPHIPTSINACALCRVLRRESARIATVVSERAEAPSLRGAPCLRGMPVVATATVVRTECRLYSLCVGGWAGERCKAIKCLGCLRVYLCVSSIQP